ncbi:MAG: sigma-70 family RNA polymerase sigma factor [Polyangiaceae bacterium]
MSSNTERVCGLVRAHSAFVARSVRRLGVPESVADDVSQRVFLTATRKLDSIEPHQERAYLFGIALRMASDARRSWQRGRLRGSGDATEVENLASSLGSPEELLERKQQRELLASVVDTLPVKERTVFVLHEFDGLPVTEIAERLELPAGTVTSQLRRARLHFEAALKRLRARQSSASSIWLLSPLPLLALVRRWFGAKGSATASGASSLSGVASWVTIGAASAGLALGGLHAVSRPSPSNARPAASAVAAVAPKAAQPAAASEPAPASSASLTQAPSKLRSQASRVAGVTPQPALSAVAQIAPSLQRELSLLRAARALLAADDVVGALDLLERYKRLPGPHGLAQEAQVLGVQALVARGARGSLEPREMTTWSVIRAARRRRPSNAWSVSREASGPRLSGLTAARVGVSGAGERR